MIRGVIYNASRFVTPTPTRSFANVPSVSPMTSILPMPKSVVNYSNVMQTQLRFPMIDIPGHEGQRQWWNMLTFLPQIKSNQIKKFYLKSVHFITIQHKLSRAFQTDMHNKLHKLNTAQ